MYVNVVQYHCILNEIWVFTLILILSLYILYSTVYTVQYTVLYCMLYSTGDTKTKTRRGITRWMHHGHRAVLLDAAAVGAGGAIGAILRAGTKHRYRGSIWSTAGVNVLGSCALGAIAAASPLAPRAKLALGAGLCGGFTTFSAFAVELTALVEAGELGVATSYFLVNNVGGAGAAFLGASVTKVLSRGRC